MKKEIVSSYQGYIDIANEDLDIINCVMCGKSAIVYAMETKEPLCLRCMLINNEARRR